MTHSLLHFISQYADTLYWSVEMVRVGSSSTLILGPLNCAPRVRPTFEDQLKWFVCANYNDFLYRCWDLTFL